jgi:hypothetical protein
VFRNASWNGGTLVFANRVHKLENKDVTLRWKSRDRSPTWKRISAIGYDNGKYTVSLSADNEWKLNSGPGSVPTTRAS